MPTCDQSAAMSLVLAQNRLEAAAGHSPTPSLKEARGAQQTSPPMRPGTPPPPRKSLSRKPMAKTESSR
eukprot:2139490-Pyramimonas_sp.AAC.1